MAIYPLRNLHLNMGNVARTMNDKGMEVSNTTIIYDYDESGQKLETIKALAITCNGYRGGQLTIKFPPSIEEKFRKLEEMMESDISVMISFKKLKLTAYALKASDGRILSGVSAKAEDFEIINDIESISKDLADMEEIKF